MMNLSFILCVLMLLQPISGDASRQDPIELLKSRQKHIKSFSAEYTFTQSSDGGGFNLPAEKHTYAYWGDSWRLNRTFNHSTDGRISKTTSVWKGKIQSYQTGDYDKDGRHGSGMVNLKNIPYPKEAYLIPSIIWGEPFVKSLENSPPPIIEVTAGESTLELTDPSNNDMLKFHIDANDKVKAIERVPPSGLKEEFSFDEYITSDGFDIPLRVQRVTYGNETITQTIQIDPKTVKINPAFSDRDFVIDFPRGTAVYDESLDAFIDDDSLARAALVNKSVNPPIIASFMIPLGILLIVLLSLASIFFLLRKRNKRT